MDEPSQLLEYIVISQQQNPVYFHEPSPNQPLVDEMVDLIPFSVDPPLPLESEVNKVVGPIQSLIDPTLPLESEVDITQVLLVTSDFSRQGVISPISTEPPLSTEVIYFDWDRLVEPLIPYYLPFQIPMQVFDNITICHTIIDEGTYVSLLSSTAWPAIGSPQFVSVTHHLWDFNKRSNEPLGILP
jgi:hypothetical protein